MSSLERISPFEEGSPNAPICILAEAPARNEIKANRPLVGYSGILFNDLLHQANIVRADCYILNVWEEEVFRSKMRQDVVFDRFGEVIWKARTGFTPIGMEMAFNTLKRLEKFRGNVICPMGAIPLTLLYGDTRISKWRGSILSSKRLNGKKIVPTYHPAYSLRGQYTARYTIKKDFDRLETESYDPQILLPKRELITDPSFPEVIAYLGDMKKKKSIATDIEVLNHQISCLSFSPDPSLSMSVPLLDGGGRGHRWTEDQETEIWLMIAEIMEDEKIEKINQNLLFDIAVEFQQNNIITKGPRQCTMCAQGILYPDFPKSLEFITSIRTREPYYKDDGKIWMKPWVDMDRFWRYNAMDAAVAHEAWLDMKPEIEDGYQWTYDRTVKLFEPLLYAMVHGMFVNRKKLADTNEAVKAKIELRKKELADVAEYPFNPGSPKQCQQYFYVTKGIKPYLSTKTGKVTCDDKALARIIKRYHLPEAKLAQEIRSLNTLSTRYLDVGLDADGRLRCSYNPRGTTTGRLSSSETIFGTGLNMQNLHDEFKDFLEADPDGC